MTTTTITLPSIPDIECQLVCTRDALEAVLTAAFGLDNERDRRALAFIAGNGLREAEAALAGFYAHAETNRGTGA